MYDEVLMEVSEKVEEEFGYVEVPVVSLPDLYAGKICAALDRQHPRDLFDIKFLLENEGLTEEIRIAFIVYLISHSRPIAEIINPIRKDITDIYHGEFANMAEIEVPLEELKAVREELIKQIASSFTKDEKNFLLSFKKLKPDWNLLGIEGVKDLPAVKWKLINLNKMAKDKHDVAIIKLEKLLSDL